MPHFEEREQFMQVVADFLNLLVSRRLKDRLICRIDCSQSFLIMNAAAGVLGIRCMKHGHEA